MGGWSKVSCARARVCPHRVRGARFELTRNSVLWCRKMYSRRILWAAHRVLTPSYVTDCHTWVRRLDKCFATGPAGVYGVIEARQRWELRNSTGQVTGSIIQVELLTSRLENGLAGVADIEAAKCTFLVGIKPLSTGKLCVSKGKYGGVCRNPERGRRSTNFEYHIINRKNQISQIWALILARLLILLRNYPLGQQLRETGMKNAWFTFSPPKFSMKGCCW